MLKRGWEYPQDVQRNIYTDDAGVTWHLLDCRYAFGDWIEQHSNKLWRMEGLPHRARYWVHEKLMGFILLRGV
jgi:hypothetical protein